MENWENIQLPWPDWTITAYLGGGGYGKVYQIERTVSGLQEEAALKIISRPADDQVSRHTMTMAMMQRAWRRHTRMSCNAM